MGKKSKSHKKTEKATAKRVELSQVNQQNDESDENESLNEEESSIINNLPISAAPVADLLQPLEIQSSVTNDDMDTSQNDINDSNTINNDLSNQQPNLLVLPILPNQK